MCWVLWTSAPDGVSGTLRLEGVPSVQAEGERARLAPAFNLAGVPRGAKKGSKLCGSTMAELEVRSRGGASDKGVEDGTAAGTCSDVPPFACVNVFVFVYHLGEPLGMKPAAGLVKLAAGSVVAFWFRVERALAIVALLFLKDARSS